jgi:hypothetical protein
MPNIPTKRLEERMVYSQGRDKLSLYMIGGPSKPFIDKNLQLQLPDCNPHQGAQTPSQSPIYSHYVGSSPSSYLPPQINEAELYHAITEAEHSYEAWKQMQQKLKEATNRYLESKDL